MKRAFLVLTAVLLAVFMAGCDNFGAPEDGVGGNRVKIVIDQDSGNTRSLIHLVAESDMDFIEVIFAKRTAAGAAIILPLVEADNEIYREAWMLNNIGTIGIPDGFDIDDPKCLAVVFGGLRDGKILLAVGKISKVNSTAFVPSNDHSNPTPIKNGDTVTFKMAALTSMVTNSGTNTGGRIPSSFKITATGTTTTTTDPAYIAPTAVIDDLPTLPFRGTNIPVYRVANSTEAGATAITAEYKFGFSERETTSPFDPKPLADADFSKYGQYIIRKQDNPSIRTMGTTLENGYTKAALSVSITTPFADGTELPQTLAFTIATQDSGLCTLFFRIPVYMCGIDISKSEFKEDVRHTKWYVQSGLDNSVLDTGTLNRSGEPVAANGTGGSILLGIGKDYDYKEKDRAEVEIGWR